MIPERSAHAPRFHLNTGVPPMMKRLSTLLRQLEDEPEASILGVALLFFMGWMLFSLPALLPLVAK